MGEKKTRRAGEAIRIIFAYKKNFQDFEALPWALPEGGGLTTLQPNSVSDLSALQATRFRPF